MAPGSSKRFCPWCGEPLRGARKFCDACGALTDDPNEGSESQSSFRLSFEAMVIWAVIISVGAYFAFNRLNDESQPDTFVPSATAPCHGWIDWDARAPDLSQLSGIYESLLAGEELTRDEYHEWVHLERDIHQHLKDAGAVPYILTEYKTHTLEWLEAMDWILTQYSNGTNDVNQLDYMKMKYHADESSREWGDAILACPPSARH